MYTYFPCVNDKYNANRVKERRLRLRLRLRGKQPFLILASAFNLKELLSLNGMTTGRQTSRTNKT